MTYGGGKTLKRLLHVGIAALIVGAFAVTSVNVSAASHANAGTTPPKLKSGLTLQIWDYFGNGSSERATEQKIADQWGKATKNHVTIQTTADNKGKMCVGAPGGNGADIVGVPHDQVSFMQACGVLAVVPPWAWTAAQKKTYIKAAIQATNLGGKTYAMPWAIETTGLFYNKSLISASAFKPAAGQKYVLWSKLIASLKSAAAAKGVNAFGWDPPNFYYDYAFIAGEGGYVFKYGKKGYDYNQIGLDTAGAVKGIDFIGKLSTKGSLGLIPDSMTGSVGDGLFTQGKELVDWTGPWNEQTFQKANVNFGFAPLPAFDATHPMRPFSGVQVYSLNKYSKHPNEAASLLSYLTTHMQVPEFKSSGRIPVITSLLTSKTVQSDPVAGGLARAAINATPIPNIAEMAQVWSPAGNAIGLVFKGQATASDAAKSMTATIKSDIAKAHGG
jgi:arabinogalactan oligomer/maltooligosaccharide transport system substrate-binding protein